MIEHFNATAIKILKMLLVFAAVLLGIFIVYRMSHYLAPFIVAFAIASLIEPIILLLIKKAGLKRKIAAPIVLLLVLSALVSLLVLLISKLINEIISFSYIAPKFFTDLYNNLTVLISKGTDFYEWLPPEISINLGSVISDLSSTFANIVKSIGKGAYATAVSIPEAIIFTLVTIVSTYFLTSDRERIFNFFKKQLPDEWIAKIISIKNDMFSALFGYVRAQLILMSITFTELFIGFSIIHIKYALLLAFIISIIDALPILGTGGILIPWSIYSFLTGNIRLGLSLISLYAVVLIVRQLTEPKVLGHQIGIYPLLTLIAMYSGLKLIGFGGLILGPITLLLLKNILSGILKNRTIKEMLNK